MPLPEGPIKEMFKAFGAKGGRKSKRSLSKEEASIMAQLRWLKSKKINHK